MNKNIIFIFMIALLLSGCGNNNLTNTNLNEATSSPNKTVNELANRLADASLNGSMQEVNNLTNELLRYRAVLQMISFEDNYSCHVVKYKYEGKDYSAKACK